MRSCEHCGESFDPPRRDAKFCCENCRKRACENRTRANCAECGVELGAGSGFPGRRTQKCRACHDSALAARRHERRLLIADRWIAGGAIWAIAKALNTTSNSVGVEMAHMRKEGWYLPHRAHKVQFKDSDRGVRDRLDLQRNRHLADARKRVYDAVKSGELLRPGCCARCGDVCKPQAHHHDYDKPLDVEWLCFDCHTLAHHPDAVAA